MCALIVVAIGLSFAREYREYLLELGEVKAGGREFTGIYKAKRLHVIDVPAVIRYRERRPHMAEVSSKYPMLVNSKENQELFYSDKCDKYDYLTAVACGAIGGVVDIFLVGAPGDSVLGKWTDEQTDKAVINFAKKMGWKPKAGNEGNVNSAIGFLEHGRSAKNPKDFHGFKVNYDQRKPSDVGNAFNIAPGTHHMMSLAHSPDIVGLFFSILNQFTSTSSFIANGQIITIKSDTFELQGGNFLMKIMCGIGNWFGHLMSDVAGSSGSHGRGSGIVMPFYELFGLCKFGSFGSEKKDLAEVAMQAFTSGYDFRFAMAQAIPVTITELTIRLIWAIRRKFQMNLPLKECIPTMTHQNLRIMLIIGHGTLCVMDVADTGIRSGGNYLAFFTRLNMVAWYRLVSLVLKEVLRQVGIVDCLDDTIASLQRVNRALDEYLAELEKIDVVRFKEETAAFRSLEADLANVSESDLNMVILRTFESLGINRPWQGDFDDFMMDRSNMLVFE